MCFKKNQLQYLEASIEQYTGRKVQLEYMAPHHEYSNNTKNGIYLLNKPNLVFYGDISVSGTNARTFYFSPYSTEFLNNYTDNTLLFSSRPPSFTVINVLSNFIFATAESTQYTAILSGHLLKVRD